MNFRFLRVGGCKIIIKIIASIHRADQAKDRVFAFMALESKLSREPIPAVASYGPRRVLYPQLGSMRDDEMALPEDPTLLTDRCLADAFVALAEAYALARVGRADAGEARATDSRPPPPRSCASFTRSGRPSISLPSRASRAASADESVSNSTKPKPRERPVSRSTMTATDEVRPCASKNSRSESSVAL